MAQKTCECGSTEIHQLASTLLDETVCIECADAIEANGRIHAAEGWCPVKGCWGDPIADFTPCREHAAELANRVVFAASHIAGAK